MFTTFGFISFAMSKFHVVYMSNSIIIVPEQHPTIQSAINAAREGDLVLVRPGKYLECITIDKSLSLVGSGANLSIIENIGGGHTIEIKKGANNVLLKGFTIKGLGYGPWAGIYVRGSKCIIEDNFVTGHYYGIKIYDSSNNILRNNLMSNNTYNFGVWGLFLSHFLHDIDCSNFVDGKPILYWVNKQNRTVPLEVGYVALINSSKITVRDLSISKSLSGILLAYTNYSLILNVTLSRNERGLYLICSNNNVVVQSNFMNNEWSGISIISSCNNTFIRNNVTQNKSSGIRLSHSVSILGVLSEKNTLVGNILSFNQDGLYLEKSNGNIISGNVIANNTRSGIVLDESRGNILRRNLVQSNRYGVWSLASRDLLYWNFFVSNSLQVYVEPYLPTLAVWDDGYPSGGNYWSDYEGLDNKSGLNQDQPGSDGMGDIPYAIDANNQDRYPLLHSYLENISPVANFSQVPSEAKVGESVLFIDDSFDIDGKILLRIWRINGEYYWLSKDILTRFEEEKAYVVNLIVFDDCGADDVKLKTVFVRRLIPTILILAPDSAIVGETLEISAILLDENGNPVAEALVDFYVINDSEEFIGSASTNFHGAATISYVPKKTGTFRIKALFSGDQKYASACIGKSLIVKLSGHSNTWIFWLLLLAILSSMFALWKIKKHHRISNEEKIRKVKQ